MAVDRRFVLSLLAVCCGPPHESYVSAGAMTGPITSAGSDSGDPPDATTSTSGGSGMDTMTATGPGSSTTSTSGVETSGAATTAPTDSSGAEDPGTSSGGGAMTICDDIAGEDFIVPSRCDGPSGNTTTEVPRNGMYATSWFGCYFGDDGEIVQDPFDNCEFACGDQGLCPGLDGPECEANLMWFAADVDRYGCGGRIRVTNCENGNAVVLVTLDRGPNCNSVEMECGAPVLDMSHDAMVYLFDGGTFGGCDHQAVFVEQVDEATPLGPV